LTTSYFTRNFHPVNGWKALFWQGEDHPGEYYAWPMPGWITKVHARSEELEYGPNPNDPPLADRDQFIVATYCDPDGHVAPFTDEPDRYIILAPGAPEPTEAEALADWKHWKNRMELRRQNFAKAGERP
jgi:hypothetical protein